jgi:hypothetical protein
VKLAGNDSPLAGLGADEVGGLDGGSALSTMSPAGKATSRFSVARGGFVRVGQRADLNPLLAEYHVLVHLDVPEIDVIWTERAAPSCPRGRKGRRRDRHYGRWRCCRQRRVQRHGKTCARPAGHARQADVAKGHPRAGAALGLAVGGNLTTERSSGYPLGPRASRDHSETDTEIRSAAVAAADQPMGRKDE